METQSTIWKLAPVLLAVIMLLVAGPSWAWEKWELYTGPGFISHNDQNSCSGDCTVVSFQDSDPTFTFSLGGYFTGLKHVDLGIEGIFPVEGGSAYLFNVRRQVGRWSVAAGVGRYRDEISASLTVPSIYVRSPSQPNAVGHINDPGKRSHPVIMLEFDVLLKKNKFGRNSVFFRYMRTDLDGSASIDGTPDVTTMPVSRVISVDLKTRREIFVVGFRSSF